MKAIMILFTVDSTQKKTPPAKAVPYPVWEGCLLPVRIEPLNKQKKRVYLDDGTTLHLYNGEIRRFQIAVDTVVEGSLYTELMHCLCKRARARALHLLRAADHPTTEIRNKLLQGGYPLAVAEDALSYLAYYGYTDDARYIANYIASHEKTQSRQQMKQALYQKGLELAQIEDLLPESGDAEQALLQRLAEKYCRDRDLSDRKEYSKLVSKLMRRGFSYAAIRDALPCQDLLELED